MNEEADRIMYKVWRWTLLMYAGEEVEQSVL